MKIGERLELLRTRSGFTRAEVSEKLGIAKSTLGHWETDYREPSYAMLEKICGIYGVSVSYLFQESWEENSVLLDKIIKNLQNEGLLNNNSKIESLDESVQQILFAALNNHMKNVLSQ